MSTFSHNYLMVDKEKKNTSEQRTLSTDVAGNPGYSHAKERF